MEKPDKNGFITVTWPSKNVPHGGIFHTRVVDNSSERQNFLKVLKEESKLNAKLRDGSMVGVLRDTGTGKAGNGRAAAAPAVVAPPVSRPHTSRRRSLSAIRLSGSFDVDKYCPLKKGEDREKLKEKLANTMAYGDTPEQVVMSLVKVEERYKKNVEKKLPSSKQMWNDLVTQIRERAEWLAEMEYLGEGGAHRDIINEQIAERMRALDALGVDSECSTDRSASGFSTRSEEQLGSGRSNTSKHSNVSKTSEKKRETRPRVSTRAPVVETVAAYNQLSPLGYSPRRRQ